MKSSLGLVVVGFVIFCTVTEIEFPANKIISAENMRLISTFCPVFEHVRDGAKFVIPNHTSVVGRAICDGKVIDKIFPLIKSLGELTVKVTLLEAPLIREVEARDTDCKGDTEVIITNLPVVI